MVAPTPTSPAKPKTDGQALRLKKRNELAKKLKKAAARSAPKKKVESKDAGEDMVGVEELAEEKKRKREEDEFDGSDQAKQSKQDLPTPLPPSNADSDSEADSDQYIRSSLPSRASTPELPLSLTPFPLSVPLIPEPTPSLLHPLTLPAALQSASLISSTFTLPLSSSSSTIPLSQRTSSRLKEMGVEQLFAVQTAVLPFLLPSTEGNVRGSLSGLYPGRKGSRDICVSAPTGSGKTLSYVVPVVEVLSKRIVTRLRALVILPTRDLVSQGRDTFEALSKGTGLKIATITGSHSFSHEKSLLVDATTGASLVDILICTPGRLIDHLALTEGFGLRDLRFLIIDEADRLLNQSFNDWLQIVLSNIRSTEPVPSSKSGDEDLLFPKGRDTWLASQPKWEGESGESSTQCQKLLFSATLTRDPSKIAALKLNDPKYFIVQDEGERNPKEFAEESFTLPPTLKESYLVLPTALKPLHLLSLLHSPTFKLRRAICFTKSVESASRLVRLIQLFEEEWVRANPKEEGVVVRGYSSDLSGGGERGERGKVLGAFGRGEIDLLVCSDLIARGIDIASVENVISYDVPVDTRKYIHRVGRTARAGREGSAWSLVESQEARHFKSLMRSFNHLEKLQKLKGEEKELEPFKESYKKALGGLKEAYSKEE